jgi:hypothetical protein
MFDAILMVDVTQYITTRPLKARHLGLLGHLELSKEFGFGARSLGPAILNGCRSVPDQDVYQHSTNHEKAAAVDKGAYFILIILNTKDHRSASELSYDKIVLMQNESGIR